MNHSNNDSSQNIYLFIVCHRIELGMTKSNKPEDSLPQRIIFYCINKEIEISVFCFADFKINN